MAKPMGATSYRLSVATQEMLDALAERLTLSKNEVVELAIRKLADAELEGDSHVVLPPGLRRFSLNQENAQAMQQLLDDPTQPAHGGQEMPTADAAVLLNKQRLANP